MEEKKVPALRFRGFDNAWEQRRLGEVCSSFDYGMNVAAKEFDGENKYIRITDIDDASREFLLRDISSPDICLEREEVSKYLLSNGDIVFARTGASVGKTYIYKKKDGVVYFAGFLIRVKVNKENDADFIFQNTLSVNYNRYITITSQRSGQPGVNAQEYSEYSIFIPLREEQKKIGNYLCNFDHLISLHQRKLEMLKKIKKSMLEKMFPKNDAKVPELRFSDFTDAWEQRRLGEVVTITMGQSPDGATYSDSPSKYILVQGNADLKDGWVFPRVWTTQKTKVCDKGDLIMSVRAPAGAMGKTAYNAVIGRGVAAIKGNEFIYQRLVKMDLCDYWKKLAAGSTFESINSDIIFNAEIAMPSGKEQKKIGSIFNKLDHLISLHQRKLEKLKNIKKSMLEKMFII